MSVRLSILASRSGRYRVLYGIDESERTMIVLSVDRDVDGMELEVLAPAAGTEE